MSTRFTDILVKSLKPKHGKKTYRREAGGFTVRIMPSGIKTWLFIYTFDGVRKEMNLGQYPSISLADARTKYNDAFESVKQGIDPAAIASKEREARRKAPIVSELVTDYIERHAKRFKKSWQKDQRMLDYDVVPEWGMRKAADITKRDVLDLLDKIVARNAPAMANNTFQIVRKMFNWAVEKDIIPHTPCATVKMPSPKVERERALNEMEIRTFWMNIDSVSISPDVARVLKLVLVTAQRPGEVSGMHVSEIDGRWWTIPAERAKNGVVHRVYLSDLAVELIGDMEGKGYLFPCPQKSKIKPILETSVATAVQRNFAWPLKDEHGNMLIDESGKIQVINRIGIDVFKPQDLRRTAATKLAKMKIPDEDIDAILNHTKKGVIKVYNRYKYDDEKKAALERWAIKLTHIINDTDKAKVIPLSTKKRHYS